MGLEGHLQMLLRDSSRVCKGGAEGGGGGERNSGRLGRRAAARRHVARFFLVLIPVSAL